MYVRFVSPIIDADTGVETGFFRAANLAYRRNQQAWVKDELSRQMRWFNSNLPVPEELGRIFKRRDSIWGICWFNPDARECIERAHYSAWLLEEAGVPIRMIKAPISREIIWRDTYQIVAKVTNDTPRAFH